MPRKPRSIHPLQMVEALSALNQAVGLFAMKARTVAQFMQQVDLPPAKVKEMGEELAAATNALHAVLWPDEE
jgi:hypothetical protein